MSPRRSSRARTTNPPTAPTNSSTSSISSGRAERATRSNNKVTSPQRSAPRSQSLDDPDDAKPPPRRTRSGHEEIKEISQVQDDDIEDEDEEEVTRCICGHAEFPGLASPLLESLKQQAKENGANIPIDLANDDTAGIFIQCDICKVWQHGGCVGIMSDESAPENYFCEECRKDLHHVATTSDGQKYSRYAPVQAEPSPPASPSQPSRDSRSSRAKEAKSRSSVDALSARRRLTMNSWNEDEQLQRAIEESKKQGVRGEESIHRSKRSRSDSEERKAPIKRQRTGSGTPSPSAEKTGAVISSSDEALVNIHKAREESPKRARGTNPRTTRDKEQLEKEKEKERQDAASRRKARSERRRGDESDTEEMPSAKDPPSNVSTPPAPEPPPRSHKKKPVSIGRRTGRNQYTRDLPPSSLHNTLDPNEDVQRRTRSRSRSVVRDTESPRGGPNGANGTAGPFGADSRPSRPKYLNISRTSFNEMKKRVAGILEFVNRAQDESARTASENNNAERTNRSTPNGVNGVKNTTSHDSPVAPIINGNIDLDFTSMDTGGMLKDLKSKLVQWEDEYGRWSRA